MTRYGRLLCSLRIPFPLRMAQHSNTLGDGASSIFLGEDVPGDLSHSDERESEWVNTILRILTYADANRNFPELLRCWCFLFASTSNRIDMITTSTVYM